MALARAVYSDNPIYLLDEPFASLDRVVARFVYENCVKKLRNDGKLIVLCTHYEQFLHDADLVIRLNEKGETEQIGFKKWNFQKKKIFRQPKGRSVEQTTDEQNRCNCCRRGIN